MGSYLFRRLLNYLVLAFLAASATYLLASLSFHPVSNWLARHPTPSASAIVYQLDLRNENPATPVLVRYGHWLSGVFHGNLGIEIGGDSVAADMGRRIGVTARLVVIAIVIGSISGVVVGIWGAVRQYRAFDRVTTFGSFVVLSVPVFTIAILLQMFAVWFNNTTGTHVLYYINEVGNPTASFWSWSSLLDRFEHLILPTASLVLGATAFFSRYQRSTMLDVMGSDFLRTARAKGLTRGQAIFRHGARTAVIPVVTLLTYNAVLLFTGAIYTETIYGWHGMGEWFIQSIGFSDVNSVAAVGLFTAGLVLIAGVLSEIATVALDPRVRSR
jgi:peptide/nickel transport system permease protein